MKRRKMAAWIFTILFGLLGWFVYGLARILSSGNEYMYVGFLCMAVFFAGNYFILHIHMRVKQKWTWAIMVLIFIVPSLLYGSYDWYIRSIEIANAEVDLSTYQPYKQESDLARLDEPAALQLDENLPELDGATALYPVYAAFAEAVYPEGTYSYEDRSESPVTVSKTNGAFQRLSRFQADIIFTAGPSDEQQETLKQMEKTAIGKEAFVFFVHKDNPVDSLTLKQLRGIYAGEITNWEDVGGRNQKIIAFQRPEGSGSQTGLENMMGKTPIMDPPRDQRVNGMGGVIEKASDYRNHRNSIGFSYRFFATKMVEGHHIKLLNINGIDPSVPHIKRGDYPLTGNFYAITNGTKNPHVEPFIEWILSSQGQQLIEDTGYVPVKETDLP
ncbi:substrate-binding domain-containing protein [Halobacillus sp. HZG1]|uniref:PstS family phosphate ABC transporter substrate-binding protein n=1 Tax=Halobacillus sp. HZG1 TaxID=3111769 RepID=UPI002DBB11FE|nr:substrate-binding domain-containing protein [Halobacillus sp. HZG1]MEC3884765.1 substrate-binding domain-containing protein [Halobacillus sp. HZG1]